MNDWTHDVVVYGHEGGLMLGCLTCRWRKHLTGDHSTPERIMDEARAHRSERTDDATD